MIGRTLDRYRIDAEIGRGGMGVVYRALDTELDRMVAVKVLPPDKLGDPDRKRRFVQEARAASSLNHAGIVTIHDVRSDDGVDFIVMEYVVGRTLDHVIPPAGLPWPQALRYGVAIADALARAHEAGIVHRDLKPSNVMITADDRVKVLDFGLAKLSTRPADDAARSSAPTMTATEVGQVIGTAAYMSPEQADGRPLDGRSDIFSFGSMLYEMVTGRRPFVGESTLSTLTKIVNDDPTLPSRLSASIPSELERLVLRCLRKDPARRFQTMSDLKVALEDVATESTGDVREGGRSARASRWPLWLASGAVLLVVLAASAWFIRRDRTGGEVGRHLEAVPLTSDPGIKRSPSFSTDGSQVAYTWRRPDQNTFHIFVQQAGAGTPLQITTDAADDLGPIWAPDGRNIAFLRRLGGSTRFDLRLIPPLGGPERKLTEIEPRPIFRVATLDWCPDSRCIVTTDTLGPGRPNALFVVQVDSGERRQLTSPPEGILGDSDPALSGDGTWLVFRRDGVPFTGALYRQPLRDGVRTAGDPVMIADTQQNAYNPRWLPGGREIVFSGRGALWRLAATEGAVPLRLPFVGQDGLMPIASGAAAVRPKLAYVRSFADSNVYRVGLAAIGAAATTPPAVVLASTRRDDIASLSVDGRRLTFISNRSGPDEVWVADADGTSAQPLTAMNMNPGFPRFSPDGALVVFHSNPNGNGDVIAVASGGGTPRNLTNNSANDTFPSVSRDGRTIYFSSTRGAGTATIWKMPVGGGPAVQVSTLPGLLAIESRDGAFVFFVEAEGTDRPGVLKRVPAGGGDAVTVATDVHPLAFDVVDAGIYYVEPRATGSSLRFLNFASGRSTLVLENLGQIVWGLTATSDGRVVMFARIDTSVDDVMLVDDFR